MYKICIRTWYTLINPFRRLYWYIFRPQTRGVKCLIECRGHFLLTRLGYAHKLWTVPGGGVKRNESWETAIRREVFEEVGIRLDAIKNIGEYKNIMEHKRDTVAVFYSSVASFDFKIDNIEIIEAQWFLPTNLPPNRRPVEKLLTMLQENLKPEKIL